MTKLLEAPITNDFRYWVAASSVPYLTIRYHHHHHHLFDAGDERSNDVYGLHGIKLQIYATSPQCVNVNYMRCCIVEEGRSVMLPLAILVNTPPSSSQTSFHTWDVPAPQTASPVFTRRDNVGEQYSDWLIAKMWVRVADVHYHIVGSLITSRLLAEMASLAVLRCLPSVHPVFSPIPLVFAV